VKTERLRLNGSGKLGSEKKEPIILGEKFVFVKIDY